MVHPYFLPTFNNTQQTFFIGLQLSTFAGELASKAIVATIQFISHRISSQKPDVVLSAGRTEHVLVHFKHGVDWHKSKEKCKWFLIIFLKDMLLGENKRACAIPIFEIQLYLITFSTPSPHRTHFTYGCDAPVSIYFMEAE